MKKQPAELYILCAELYDLIEDVKNRVLDLEGAVNKDENNERVLSYTAEIFGLLKEAQEALENIC